VKIQLRNDNERNLIMTEGLAPRQDPALRPVTREQAVEGVAGALRVGAVVLIAPDGSAPLCARLLGALEDELHHWAAVMEKPDVELLTLTNRAAWIAAAAPPVTTLVMMQRADADQLLAYASVPQLEPDERHRLFVDEIDMATGTPRYPELYLDALELVDPETAGQLRGLAG
jgi:hypothetical protein